SSDAAAALLALNRLWELALSREELAELAGELGSDVPFFLWGGTALAVGRGEQVTPLPAIASVPVTLICPKTTLPQKTAQLYALVTPAQYSDGGITRRMMQTLMGGSFVVDFVHNSFEAVALQAFPDLEQVYRAVAQIAQATPHLAGSGPALFCLPSSKEEHLSLVEALQPYDVEAYLVHTIAPSQPIKA
ncbi:MAG: 4-(cytidine 5'-diphospho)-2-C-methyl-D-erythritol kinase, partial [Dehalococcoidia bacterium]